MKFFDRGSKCCVEFSRPRKYPIPVIREPFEGLNKVTIDVSKKTESEIPPIEI